MTYSNITLINLCVMIAAAIMFVVGFVLMVLDKEKYKTKSKLLRNISLTVAIIVQVIAVLLIAFKDKLILI